MNHPKARFLCALCGRQGARAVYVILGAALVILGARIAMRVTHDRK